QVQVSKNGGADFTTVGILANVTANSTSTFDISSYISENTVIKFKVASGFATDSSQRFFFDNVAITADSRNYIGGYSELAATPVQILDAASTISLADSGQPIVSATITLT